MGKAHPEFQGHVEEVDVDPRQHRRGPDYKAAGAALAMQFAVFALDDACNGWHRRINHPRTRRRTASPPFDGASASIGSLFGPISLSRRG